MFSKDLSILFIFIAGQSNFETALATCCAARSNLKFATAALVLKSLPTPVLDPTSKMCKILSNMVSLYCFFLYGALRLI